MRIRFIRKRAGCGRFIRPSVFEFAHQYVWQALIMLDVLIVWLLWVRTVPRGIPAVTA